MSFFLQIQPYKDYPDLRTLMKELQEFCENSDEFIPTDMVEIGEAYAAKNPDGFFHRFVFFFQQFKNLFFK